MMFDVDFNSTLISHIFATSLIDTQLKDMLGIERIKGMIHKLCVKFSLGASKKINSTCFEIHVIQPTSLPFFM